MVIHSFTNAALMQLLRGVSRSFYLSIRLLPAPVRVPVGLAYLLARATDTVADTTALPADERQALLTQMISAISEGVPPTPLQLYKQLNRFAARQSDLAERALMHALPLCLQWLDQLNEADQRSVRWVLGHITQGQTLDVARFGEGPGSLQTESELQQYTWLVAGCVGEFWTEVCARHLPGFSNLPQDTLLALGRRYGMGLQRLNILRDAQADLLSGRCYLPASRLSCLGLSPATLTQASQTGDVPTLALLMPLWQEYLDQTREMLADGMRYSLSLNNRRLRLATALPALIGVRTVELLQRAATRSLCARVKIPRREVYLLLCRLSLGLGSARTLQGEFQRLTTAD